MHSDTKICARCEADVAVGNYYKQAGRLRSWCKACCKAYAAQRHQRDPERHHLLARAWERNNRVKCVDRQRIRRQRPEVSAAQRKAALRWKQENPARAKRNMEAYRNGLNRAQPTWANEFFMNEAYRLARLRSKVTGREWHVDHIVPLNNKAVCGLHCEFNLNVIPASANRTKGNRTWPDMPLC